MVLGALGCMNNTDFEKKKKLVNDMLHIVTIFRCALEKSMAEPGI